MAAIVEISGEQAGLGPSNTQKAPRISGGRMQTMPAIPEETPLGSDNMDGGKRARDLLQFVLGDENEGVSSDDHREASKVKVDNLAHSKEAKSSVKGFFKTKSRSKNESATLVVQAPAIQDERSDKKNKGSKKGRAKVHVISDEDEMAAADLEAAVSPVPLAVPAPAALPLTAVSSGSQHDSFSIIAPQQAPPSPTLGKLAVLLYALVNLEIVGLIVLLAFLVGGPVSYGIAGTLGALYVGLLAFNFHMASEPEKVLRSFLASKAKSPLGRMRGFGQVVVVKGRVARLPGELLSSEVEDVEGCVVITTSVKSRLPPQGGERAPEWREHARELCVVDFRVVDEATGASAVVRASHALPRGEVAPVVKSAAQVPLVSAGRYPAFVEALEEEDQMRLQAAEDADAELAVFEGYICVGQEVTVMGTLSEGSYPGDLVIEPLRAPHNVSKLLLVWAWGVVPVPVFFPTWVTGLIVSE
eukprot:jgi/Mesen1/3248/ME000187S02409